jgi:hypothetical protein
VSRYIGYMSFLWLAIDDPPTPMSRRGYIDHNSNIGEYEQNGGYWANGTINQLSWVRPNVNQDTALIYSQFGNGGIGVSVASQTWTQDGLPHLDGACFVEAIPRSGHRI